MKDLKAFLLENKLDAASKFFQTLKDYGYKRDEIAEITKNAPKWIYGDDVLFMDVDEIGDNDKAFDYLCDYDGKNFDNVIAIADSSYAESGATLKYNDNVFAVEGGDASLLLYKKGFKF